MELKEYSLFCLILTVFLTNGGRATRTGNSSSSDECAVPPPLIGHGRERRDSNPDCVSGMTRDDLPKYIPARTPTGHPAICDTKTDGGGWFVIQRRVDGKENFNRNWHDYKKGFGSIKGDFWFGNEAIHQLTSYDLHELRVDMIFKGTNFYAQYEHFIVFGETSGYKMVLGRFSGSATNALKYHNGKKFSTIDRENDSARQGCPSRHEAGWWYAYCVKAHLNGRGGNVKFDGGWLKGLYWSGVTPFQGPYLSYVEMKIRRSTLP